MFSFLNTLWAPLWALFQPYVVPAMAWIAGDTYRRQLEHIKQLEAENAQKQAAIDMLKVDAGPVAGSAERLRNSKWNRPS